MNATKTSLRRMQLLGFIILAAGVLDFASDLVRRTLYAAPQDLGIVLGNGSLILIGCVTTWIAKELKKVDERLDTLENGSGR